MADLMKADELKARLKKIPEWELEKKHIERTFEFDDFSESIDFVNGVAEVAEDEEHHPDDVAVAAFVAIMLLVGKRVIPWILHYVAHTGSRELFRLSVLAVYLSTICACMRMLASGAKSMS